MKAIPVTLIALLFFAAANGTESTPTRPPAMRNSPSAFVPDALHPISMAMPMRQFIRDVASQPPRIWESSPRGTSWFRSFEHQPFLSATLNFSIRTHQLVEIKLRFHSEVEALAYAQREIFPRGQPASSDSDTTIYRISTADRTTIDCWVDQQNLYIIALLPEPGW